MEYNKSLSARIRRRNKCGFSGLGTGKIIIRKKVRSFNSVRASKMGDYTDPEQNHKNVDYKNSIALKQRAGLKFKSWNHKHLMSKRYADNHQKL